MSRVHILDRAAACAELLQAWPELRTFVADVPAVRTAKAQGHTFRTIGERTSATRETAGQIAAGKNRRHRT